ncbi:MAG: DUF2301 domain-containing membrane protein [Leptolyngbya sp. SIO1D8]|nr:DUF2301 domain-containing membrane protein [Leptolyngbya sp. SIO1D8]
MALSADSRQEPIIYQGQFGPFQIEDHDRQEVIGYRTGLVIAALCFALGTASVLWWGDQIWVLQSLSLLYIVFWLALGFSLLKIHIYLKPLHLLLQGFWLIGGFASLAIAHFSPDPFVLTVYQQPASLWGVGFTFAALTGIFFKEAFCFNRLETKLLTPLVPLLILGHMFHFLPEQWKGILLGTWAVSFLIFALRKVMQPIPPDIGDKSVFEYLVRQKEQAQTSS